MPSNVQQLDIILIIYSVGCRFFVFRSCMQQFEMPLLIYTQAKRQPEFHRYNPNTSIPYGRRIVKVLANPLKVKYY